MKLINKLKKNLILPIYTDYQENEDYEGKAILIEKVRDGDSFYLKNESIRVDRDKRKYSKKERIKLEKYNRLKYFFYGLNTPPDKELIKLKKELTSLRKDKVEDYSKMWDLLEKYKIEFKNSPRKIKAVLTEFDNDYIIRFIQQDRIEWNPTIYTYERWKVEFKEDHTGWPIKFRTERNIRVISKINPKENTKNADIIKYTTYNDGIPSAIPRKKRKNKSIINSHIDLTIDDDDFDELIKQKINE